MKLLPDLFAKRIDKRINGRIEKMAIVIIIFPVICLPDEAIFFKKLDGPGVIWIYIGFDRM